MDGGKHMAALAPEADRRSTGLGDWAGRLAARAEAPPPAAAATGWAARLTAHLRQAGGLRVPSPPAVPATANPAAPLVEALALLREQLLRERGRADAAEAALAAAETRLAEAARRGEKAEKEAQSAQQALRWLRGRGLIARILNAD